MKETLIAIGISILLLGLWLAGLIWGYEHDIGRPIY